MKTYGNSLYYSSMMEKRKLSRKFVVALLGQRYLSRKGRKKPMLALLKWVSTLKLLRAMVMWGALGWNNYMRVL